MAVGSRRLSSEVVGFVAGGGRTYESSTAGHAHLVWPKSGGYGRLAGMFLQPGQPLGDPAGNLPGKTGSSFFEER